MDPQTEAAPATAAGQKKIYLLMVLAAFFWSGAFIAGKYSGPYIPAFTLTFLRFLVAASILLVIIKVRRLSLRIQKADVPVFLCTGIVGMFGYHVLFFQSLHYTTAINSSLLAALGPIITIVLAVLFLGQKLKGRQILGICISFVGVLLTITGCSLETLRTLSFNRGDLLMLTAVLLWAIYGIYSKAKGQRFDPTILTFYSFVVCVLVLVPFVLLEQPWTFLATVPAPAWGAVLYMAVCPSVIGYLSQQMAIKTIGPSNTAMFTNLVPFFSILLSITLLGESFNPLQLLTGALIITGVVICQRS